MNSRQYHMLREKKKGGATEHLRTISAPFTFEELHSRITEEPAICKHFACGKTLSSEEQLYGQYCIHHSQKRQINRNLVASAIFS